MPYVASKTQHSQSQAGQDDTRHAIVPMTAEEIERYRPARSIRHWVKRHLNLKQRLKDVPLLDIRWLSSIVASDVCSDSVAYREPRRRLQDIALFERNLEDDLYMGNWFLELMEANRDHIEILRSLIEPKLLMHSWSVDLFAKLSFCGRPDCERIAAALASRYEVRTSEMTEFRLWEGTKLTRTTYPGVVLMAATYLSPT